MRTRTMVAVAATAALLTLGCGLSDPSTVTPGGVEVEDCDHEDWVNREDDCGFTEWDRKKTAKPTPRKTTTKASPRPSRRR